MPVLILIACVLVLAQPWLSAWLAARRGGRAGPGRARLLSAGVCLSGAYGGYFGAAQGVLVIGLLGSFLDENLQRVNGAKNVLVAIVNGTAAVVFIIFAHVSWLVVVLIAVGSTIGGLLGRAVRAPAAAAGAADVRRGDRRDLRRQADLLLTLGLRSVMFRVRNTA